MRHDKQKKAYAAFVRCCDRRHTDHRAEKCRREGSYPCASRDRWLFHARPLRSRYRYRPAVMSGSHYCGRVCAAPKCDDTRVRVRKIEVLGLREW